MQRRTLTLATAEKLINHNRAEEYGAADISFHRIAMLWSAYTGHTINKADVANMMVLLKVARAKASPQKQDSYDDMAGYAALAAELAIGELTDEEKNSL